MCTFVIANNNNVITHNIMKIYILLNQLDQYEGTTASKELAQRFCKYSKERGRTKKIVEMEVKTKGKDFDTWGNYTNIEEF